MDLAIKGVVFDMDGLMFDTEWLTYKIIRDTMLANGYDYDLDFYKTTVGKRSADVVKLYRDRFGESFDYQQMKVKNMEKFWEYTAQNGVPIKIGLFSLLNFLKENGIKIALATSTTEKSATKILKRAKVFEYFDVLLCAESVKNGKPDPEVFSTAVEKLGLKPRECIGLEDSFNGIVSSSGAGLVTIMVPDMIEPTQEIKNLCYRVCSDLDEVTEIIKRNKGAVQ